MRNEIKFLQHGEKFVALIGKSGSSAISKAIQLSLKPDYQIISVSGNAEMVSKVSNSAGIWQGAVSSVENPTLPAIPVRDPIERFRSACAQEGITADEALAKIDKVNFHFRPTSAHVTVDCVLFKFPEHLDELAAFLGLESIDRVNDGETNNPPKPDLTAEQLTLVREIYADDIALYASIATAGQSLTVAPPEPEPEPIYVPQSITAWQAQAALKLTPYGEGTLYTAVIAALDAMPDGAPKVVTQTAFEKDAKFVRTSPTIAAIAAALSLTDADVDALFILGDSLEV